MYIWPLGPKHPSQAAMLPAIDEELLGKTHENVEMLEITNRPMAQDDKEVCTNTNGKTKLDHQAVSHT